ncbi:17351_t:CDS:2 [Dentiscutata erythropus]|uniref:17351_t:CDS:1 n=1 Tax=Dentiscutata erythropus TaxID=1348616 RepID=A0A9N9NHW1_9GLOM|nr:17351_t:CDS:2 [Dentiscutata erythropus]
MVVKEEWEKTEERTIFRLVTSSILASGGALALLKIVCENIKSQKETINSYTNTVISLAKNINADKALKPSLIPRINKLINEEEKNNAAFIILVSLYVIITSTISIMINTKIIPHLSVYEDRILAISIIVIDFNEHDEDMKKLKKKDMDGTEDFNEHEIKDMDGKENKDGTEDSNEHEIKNKDGNNEEEICEDLNKYDWVKFFIDKKNYRRKYKARIFGYNEDRKGISIESGWKLAVECFTDKGQMSKDHQIMPSPDNQKPSPDNQKPSPDNQDLPPEKGKVDNIIEKHVIAFAMVSLRIRTKYIFKIESIEITETQRKNLRKIMCLAKCDNF